MPGAKRKKLEICTECKNSAKPAINAAKLGHAQCLTTAYRDLGAFNERDDFGATPIHFAARFGKLECLEWLVTRSGVSPNAVSRNGATAAHDAAAMGHIDCLEYLLKNTKCSSQDTTSEGATVLHMACRFGRLNVVKWLMEFSNSTPGEKGANDVTPLHLCAAQNHLDCLQYLTQHPGYVPNEQTVHGATPLYFAAQEGCLEALVWLAESGGADLYIQASDGMAAVHAAAQAGKTLCLEWLVNKGGVPVRHKAKDGATPAHFAAASGQVDCLDWIINHGGSFYDRDHLGGTPAHDAAEQGQVMTLKLLLDHGVDVDTEDFEGMKPLDLARDNNHEECVQLLFKTIKPSLLESLTPHQSLSRGASRANDNEAAREQAEKQRLFEEAMLSGVSEERREAMWQSAQQKATSVQPGLKLILDGEAVTSPSSLSVEPQSPVDPTTSSIQLTPISSVRHSKHSTRASNVPKDDAQPTKTRPALTTELFQYPEEEVTQPKRVKTDSTESAPVPKKLKSPDKAPPHKRPASPPRKQPGKSSQPAKKPSRPMSPPPKGTKRPTSPPPKGAKRATSPPPKGAKRVTSPPPKGAKRATSPPPKGAKQATSPPPKGAKRATSPPPKAAKRPSSPPSKRPTSPAPKISTKRPTSPPPRQSRRATSPPSARESRKVSSTSSPPPKKEPQRATSPPPKGGKRPTSPGPKAVKRATSPPPKKPTSPPPKAADRATSLPPKDAKRPGLKAVSTPPPTAAKSPPQKTAKRPTSPAPKPSKRPVSPPPKGAKRPSSPPPKGAKRPNSPPPKAAKRPSSPPPKGAKKPTSPSAREERGRPRERADKKRPQSQQAHKTDQMSAALGNVPEGDVTTKLANQKIEQLLNESTVAPDAVPGPDSADQPTEEQQVEQFAEKVAGNVLEETLVHQDGTTKDVPSSMEEVAKDETVGPPSPTEEVTKDETEDPAETAPAADEVVMRKSSNQTQPRAASFKEEAVISKPPLRQSLKTGDETVTVKFVTKTSNIKQPFPVTHHQLLTGDDLESPGASDDEGAQRESFTTPGYDRLDASNFDSFGTDIKTGPSDMEEATKEEAEYVKQVLDLDESKDQETLDKPVEGVEEEKKETKEHVEEPSKQSMEDNNKTEDSPPSEEQTGEDQAAEGPSKDSKQSEGLSRWSNRHSLDKIDQLALSSQWARKDVAKKKPPPLDDLGPTEVYRRLQDFESQKKERGYTEVLKIVDRFQGDRKSQPKEEAVSAANQIGAGKVSDRLKMFGGGAAFIKPPAQRSRADTPSPKESPSNSRDTSPGRNKNLTRRSSSCLSVTAFETIAEESTSAGEDSPDGETTDKVPPLPSIQPSLSRRHSEDKLRLDGLKTPGDDGLSASKSDTNVQPESSGNKSPSPTVSQRRYSGSAVSPLVVSSSPTTKKSRPVSMPPSPPKGSEALALYMNSANLPHLDHVKERHNREQLRAVDQRIALLLAPPKMTGDKVPLEFRGVDFMEKSKLHVWKQKAGSLTKLASLDVLTFDPKSLFLFLYTPTNAPPVHHIYVWVGAGVSHFAVQSAYQHCMRLAECTPGRPHLHKEFQGHESTSFSSALKTAGKELSDFHHPYINAKLKDSLLFSYKDSSFVEVKSHDSLSKHGTPLLLDTAVGLWVWLPVSYCGSQSPLEISELYIGQNNYSKWTPVTVVTEGVEAEQFAAHFPFWPWVDLAKGQRSSELSLLTVQPPAVTYPATGQKKSWQLIDGQLEPVGLNEMGQFLSSGLYVVQYSYLKQSPLYTWMEGSVYIWVGAVLKGDRRALINQALSRIQTVTPTKLPTMVVPEGCEPVQLLNLFKGKCIIHQHSQKDGPRLYKVSGGTVLTMKAVEVPPTVSSLHSSHTFILRGREGPWSVWAGQFSSQAERRGALVIVKTLSNSTRDLVKLAEGLETQGFWEELGGKGKYPHFDPPSSPTYLQAHLYECEVTKETVLFKEQAATNRADLRNTNCYILSYKDQVFVWTGAEWKGAQPPLSLVRTYLHQYHSRRREEEFLITMVTSGNEGEMFWKWFDLQNPGVVVPDDPSSIGVAPEATTEDLEQFDSMVVVQDPPEAAPGRPLSLTPSQEATIERVEKMQSELTDLVEREASEGSGDEPDGGMEATKSEDKEKATKKEDEEEATKSDGVETSPFRTSEAINQMSDVINGLDDMLKASTENVQVTPTDEKTTPPPESAEPSTVSLQVPSVGNLMETAEDENIKTPPVVKKSKKRPSSGAPQPPPSLLVTVEIESKGRTVDVRVREKAPVITVMFKAARAAGLSLTTNSALFEVVTSLKLYRALEDHELIRDVMTAWPKKDRPTLMLKEFVTKNVLWSNSPPIAHKDISAYIKRNVVPTLSSSLQYSNKGAGRLPWKDGEFTLRALGMYSVTKSKKKGTEVNLATSLDHVLYIPLVVDSKFYNTPTQFCFVMKPPDSWREKDLTFYCATSLPVMSKWIHLCRLFKHGIQLKANYIAMQTRVEKQASKSNAEDSKGH